ncbi:amidase [Nocardia xishanensis]
MSELHDLTLTELGAGLSAKRFSSRDIVEVLLRRIDRANEKLHAFSEIYGKEARALADASDTARSSGFPLGPLHGLPIAYKDLFDIAGRADTNGPSTETANTVRRLTAAGMVPLGKQQMMLDIVENMNLVASGVNPLRGTPWNPWDLTTHRVPGGSSSGTGVAVAARLVPAGIGSDTGGSVRIPSALNGVVGLKVTHGRIGLSGTKLASWTLDTIGPLARSVEDCALLLNALAAPDPGDPATLTQPVEDFTLATQPGSITGMRIALPDVDQLPDYTDPDVIKTWQESARTFENLGAIVEPTRLPEWYFDLARRAGAVIKSEALALHRAHDEDPATSISAAVGPRILAAEGLVPDSYAEEIRIMAGHRRDFADWFHGFDAILLPTVARPAIPLADVDDATPSPADLTRQVNYFGLCSLAMPSGQADGLPLSIQLVGKPFAERDVLRLGKAFQDATDFHRSTPDLSSIGL